MPHLVELATTPPKFEAGPIIEAEGAAMLRAVLTLFGRWRVTDAEAAILLDIAPRTLARRKAGTSGGLSRDQKARLSNLIGIHKALRIIFGDPARAYDWVRRPNAAFGGRSALQVMLGGELTDLMRVRRYLDAERGG
jgi:uncharacterized protein (DUF2384 family)